MDDLLALVHSAVIRRENVADILGVNDTTSQAGLVFSPGQAAALLEARDLALAGSGRLELGTGVVKKLILAFYDSPFFFRERAVDTLESLTDTFYQLKNETFDTLSDDELIRFLREHFDGECQGSLTMLRDAAFEQLVRQAHGAAREDEREDGWEDSDA